MSDVSAEVRLCPGCGAPLQSSDPHARGYLPPEKWDDPRALCMRCFRMLHYGDPTAVRLSSEDFAEAMASLAKQKVVLLLVVDLLDVEAGLGLSLPRGPHHPVLLIGNKEDLLPRSVRRERVARWLERRAREFDLEPVDVILLSAKRRRNLEALVAAMERFAGKFRTFAAVGVANAGKSTLLNALREVLAPAATKGDAPPIPLTVSPFPGTTLSVVRLDLPGDLTLYDTPGALPQSTIAPRLLPEELKILVPQEEIRPRVYQLRDPGQTIFLGGLVRVDFVSGPPQPLVVYASPRIRVHRMKLARADELYARHVGELLFPPTRDRAERFALRERISLRLPALPEKRDIAVGSVGWVVQHGHPGEFVVHVPEGVRVYVREAMV